MVSASGAGAGGANEGSPEDDQDVVGDDQPGETGGTAEAAEDAWAGWRRRGWWWWIPCSYFRWGTFIGWNRGATPPGG